MLYFRIYYAEDVSISTVCVNEIIQQFMGNYIIYDVTKSNALFAVFFR